MSSTCQEEQTKRICHSERSEESLHDKSPFHEEDLRLAILRYAQNDNVA